MVFSPIVTNTIDPIESYPDIRSPRQNQVRNMFRFRNVMFEGEHRDFSVKHLYIISHPVS